VLATELFAFTHWRFPMVNEFRIEGVVPTAPELKQLRSGSLMTRLVVVIPEEQRSKFHRISLVCFDDLAKKVADSVRAGDKVAVQGCFDTFRGVSPAGVPFARISFKARSVANLNPKSPPVVEAGEFMPALYQQLLFTGDLTPAERTVLVKALHRLTKQAGSGCEAEASPFAPVTHQ
jgi:hypothetical protein